MQGVSCQGHTSGPIHQPEKQCSLSMGTDFGGTMTLFGQNINQTADIIIKNIYLCDTCGIYRWDDVMVIN